jgi:hypothetical protein
LNNPFSLAPPYGRAEYLMLFEKGNMRSFVRISRVALFVLVGFVPVVSPAQLPLAPIAKSGQTVTPVYEGWYRNPDGSFSLSFGYYNRNSDEVIEIPIGADNFVTPGDSNRGQPTRFEARRHWGVFAVKVPANFGQQKVTWTVRVKGETFAIPGSLHVDWEIDALAGEAGSGNTPPALKFPGLPVSSGGATAQGPGGASYGPVSATTGQPLTLTILVTDDGRGGGSVTGSRGGQVALMWFKHQGPGSVTFSERAPKPATDGLATTTATFSHAGTYVLRVRANDSSVSGAGHAQCCWTNGFVIVNVR